jgi:hypothetical protein
VGPPLTAPSFFDYFEFFGGAFRAFKILCASLKRRLT